MIVSHVMPREIQCSQQHLKDLKRCGLCFSARPSAKYCKDAIWTRLQPLLLYLCLPVGLDFHSLPRKRIFLQSKPVATHIVTLQTQFFRPLPRLLPLPTTRLPPLRVPTSTPQPRVQSILTIFGILCSHTTWFPLMRPTYNHHGYWEACFRSHLRSP
jgi:hypothetical protein